MTLVRGGGGVLLKILDGGVLPVSPNPDPTSDQKMLFLTNEPAKKAEINILTARDTTGPGY